MLQLRGRGQRCVEPWAFAGPVCLTDAAGNSRQNLYTEGGRLYRQEAPGGAPILYTYTADGKISTVVGFSGVTKEYRWCCCGMEAYKDETGWTLIERDALHHVTSIAYSSGKTVTLTPNLQGWTTKITLPNDTTSEDTTYAFNLAGEISSVTLPDTPSPSTVTIARTSMGWVSNVSYSGSHNVDYAHNDEGLVTSVTSNGNGPSNTYSLTYAYVTDSDRVSSVTVKQSTTTVATQTYTYNARNQLTRELVQDGVPATTYEHDYLYTAAGLRTSDDDRVALWESEFSYGEAGHLTQIQNTDNSGAANPNPFPWGEGATAVQSTPNGDVVSLVNGSSRITHKFDEEGRPVEIQPATGDPVAISYDAVGAPRSIVQGSTTQNLLTHQGRILQTWDENDLLQDRLFWLGPHLLRTGIDAAAQNQVWDAPGSNTLSYTTAGVLDKARIWGRWGAEVFSAGAGAAPDVGYMSNFDLGTSGVSLTPQDNAWWPPLARNLEGRWRARFQPPPCRAVWVEPVGWEGEGFFAYCSRCQLYCGGLSVGPEGPFRHSDGIACPRGGLPHDISNSDSDRFAQCCGVRPCLHQDPGLSCDAEHGKCLNRALGVVFSAAGTVCLIKLGRCYLKCPSRVAAAWTCAKSCLAGWVLCMGKGLSGAIAAACHCERQRAECRGEDTPDCTGVDFIDKLIDEVGDWLF